MMTGLTEEIRQYVIDRSEAYKRDSEDHYDFWNEHIRYVYKEAMKLAGQYHADETIVALGALLHDIALIEKAGDRKDKDRVLGCVLHHRSSKNAANIEELCVCDADILAHFDNIPMLFNSAFSRNNVPLNKVREGMKMAFEADYNDLSERTKVLFRERYQMITEIVLGCDQDEQE